MFKGAALAKKCFYPNPREDAEGGEGSGALKVWRGVSLIYPQASRAFRAGLHFHKLDVAIDKRDELKIGDAKNGDGSL